MKKKLSKLELALKKIAVALQAYINEHINNTSNPHSVTKTQVGLSNVTNDSQVKRSEMGANNGVATLGADGKVPSSQLPSYTLDDVLDGLNRKIPTKVSELTNDSGFLTGHQSLVDYATKTFVENKFKDAFGINASGVSDLAAILADEDYTTGILNVITNKVDKVSGKGLSTNDYTTTEKNKLSGIESGAQVHIAPTTAEVKSALGTGSGTSKYLREDGTWQKPPNDLYESKQASSGGTAVSLVTTGEKYTWNSKQDALSFNQTPSSSNKVATMADIPTVSYPVTSVAGKTGAVTLAKGDVGLGNVDNTADANKSVNYANSAGNADTVDGYHAGAFMVFDNNQNYVNCDFVDGNIAEKARNTYIEFYQGGWFNVMVGTLYAALDVQVDGKSVIHSGNIGSQSVNYATTAGSAPANGGNSSTVNGHTVNSDVPAGAVFTDTNTWRPLGTGADDACAGNDSRLSDARPASDVYSWAKQSTKPSYSYNEISGAPAAPTIGYTTVDQNVTDINASAATQIATLNANALLKTSLSLTSGEKSLVLTNLGIASARNIIISTSEPTSSDGNDGDIWFVYET